MHTQKKKQKKKKKKKQEKKTYTLVSLPKLGLLHLGANLFSLRATPMIKGGQSYPS